ncbi:MAG TPA: hypothetical protein VJH91_02175 [Candidatus Paceibacterota bacterium]
MLDTVRGNLIGLLRWSEKYTKTDMVYLAESGFWMNLTTVLLSFFAFLLYIVFANTLPKETYGVYQYLLSLSAIISSLTLTGMNLAVMQAVPRGYEGTFRASVGVQLRWSAIALAASCLGALYYLVHGNAELAKGLILIGLLLPVVNAFNTFGAYLAGTRRFEEFFFYSMYLYVPLYAALAIGAYATVNSVTLLLINLGVQVILMILIYRSILSRFKPNANIDDESIAYGKRLSIVNVFGAAAGQIDNILAFHFLGAAPLAVYSFATAIPDRLGGLFKFVQTAALPKFAARTTEEIQGSIVGKVWRTALVALFGACGYMLIAPFIFKIFFPAYVDAIPYSQLYALTMILYATNIWVTAIISQRLTKEYAVYSIGTSITQTAILLVGIVFWGLWGLVAAKIISNLLSGLVAGALFMFKRGR